MMAQRQLMMTCFLLAALAFQTGEYAMYMYYTLWR